MTKIFTTISATGASSGIGQAIAIEFAKNGTSLVITGRNQERLQETVQKCIQAGLACGQVRLAFNIPL